jgi:hypothetical protein
MRPLPGYMRFTSSPLRALTMAGSIVLLSLLSVCLADAAPRRGTSGPICDPQTPVARKLPRHPKSFGGPLKRPSSHAMAGLSDITARVLRGTRAYLGDDVAAIQNDTPVTGTDADDCLVPSLRPLEIIGSLDVQPRSRAFSPRSPRGPPLSA